jgi:small subunit ribosomal protein S17
MSTDQTETETPDTPQTEEAAAPAAASGVTPAEPEGRGARKVRVGMVVSDKMDKTVVVQVERRVKHPKYHKTITRSKRYKAHDENNDAGVGDRVRIVETRRLSKDKYFRLADILERAK